MTAFFVTGARWLGVAAAIVVVALVVWAIMAAIDRARTDRDREQQRERDYWRTTKADPRNSKRPGNWPPTGGLAA